VVGLGNKDIPNIGGFRTDVVNMLKAMPVPMLRWPVAVMPTITIGAMASAHWRAAHAAWNVLRLAGRG